jgi:hypothetical protein
MRLRCATGEVSGTTAEALLLHTARIGLTDFVSRVGNAGGSMAQPCEQASAVGAVTAAWCGRGEVSS